jgi:ABC-type multidrug transport system ATPase subunit
LPVSSTGCSGRNGAGKTTLIRILATLLRPDASTARIAGYDVTRHPAEVRDRIGLAGQFAAVDDHLTGRENIAQYLDEADHLTDRIAVIDDGDLLTEGTTTTELKDRTGGAVVELTVPAGRHEATLTALRPLAANRERIVLPAPDGPLTLRHALRLLDHADITPPGVAPHRPTLDDVFLTLTQGAGSESVPAGEPHDHRDRSRPPPSPDTHHTGVITRRNLLDPGGPRLGRGLLRPVRPVRHPQLRTQRAVTRFRDRARQD